MGTKGTKHQPTRNEQETTATFCAAESRWRIYTCVPKHVRRFTKLGFEQVGCDGAGVFFQATEYCLRFTKADRKPRKLSESHKRALAAGRESALEI